MKFGINLFLTILFLGFNGIIYYLTSSNLNNTTKIILGNKLNILATHYNILLETQEKIADSSYQSTLTNDKIIEILQLANNATPQKQNELRDKLHHIVSPMYTIFKNEGVLQYQFANSKNNRNFDLTYAAIPFENSFINTSNGVLNPSDFLGL